MTLYSAYYILHTGVWYGIKLNQHSTSYTIPVLFNKQHNKILSSYPVVVKTPNEFSVNSSHAALVRKPN
jgi:hypothetical protein